MVVFMISNCYGWAKANNCVEGRMKPYRVRDRIRDKLSDDRKKVVVSFTVVTKRSTEINEAMSNDHYKIATEFVLFVSFDTMYKNRSQAKYFPSKRTSCRHCSGTFRCVNSIGSTLLKKWHPQRFFRRQSSIWIQL